MGATVHEMSSNLQHVSQVLPYNTNRLTLEYRCTNTGEERDMYTVTLTLSITFIRMRRDAPSTGDRVGPACSALKSYVLRTTSS